MDAMFPPLRKNLAGVHGGNSCLLVDEESNQCTTGKSADDCKWKGARWKAQANAADEDNPLKAFPENGDER